MLNETFLRDSQRIALSSLAVILLGYVGVTGVAKAEAADAADTSVEAGAATSTDSSADSSAQAAGSSDRGGPLSKLQIHGFITQAIATANFVEGRFPGPGGSPAGPTPEEISLGIPEGSTTTDYRFLALQFRYDISSNDTMVIQLSSRSLGDSPIDELEDEIQLDWAFYEHRFGSNTSVKVGRVPIPFGIFNEVRDVGTILPFYRPAFVFYREGAFTNETVDGIALSQSFLTQRSWSLDLDAYFGGWDSFELGIGTDVVALAQRNEESWGLSLWVNTSLPGLRFGTGYQRRKSGGGLEGVFRLPGATTNFDDYYASIDAVFEKFVFRAEVRSFENDPAIFPLFSPVDKFQASFPHYYAQVGFHPTSKFRIYLQGEVSNQKGKLALFTEDIDAKSRVDYGIALNYLFTPTLVVKAEYHEVSGEDFSLVPVVLPQGFRLQPIYSDLDNGDYVILSLSASF